MPKYLLILGLLAGPFLSSAMAAADVKADYRQAQALLAQKDYPKASELLFRVHRMTTDAKLKAQVAYRLGLCFYKMKLYQAASFSFIEVVRLSSDSESKKSALDLLLQISDQLKEPSLIRYAIKMSTPANLSPSTLALYHSLKGRILAERGDSPGARQEFSQALTENPKRLDILYSIGLQSLKENKPDDAIFSFQKIIDLTANFSPVDERRGMALLSMGRSYYQAKKWPQAILYYRQIPKDSPLYRKSLMELSWALFRNGQLRSSLSPLQTLHSEFYENFYDPESLLLRSIITLFSCRYDEVEKTLKSFEANYRPAYGQIDQWLKQSPSLQVAFDTFEKVLRAGPPVVLKGSLPDSGLPYFVVRSIADETDVAGELKYRTGLETEEKIATATFPQTGSSIATYVHTVIKGRQKASNSRLAHEVLVHLDDYEQNLADFLNRGEFVHYEMLSSISKALKRKMDISKEAPIDRDVGRSFYIQNGYRYWPFQGEYWRDEVGNYQFVGRDLCEFEK